MNKPIKLSPHIEFIFKLLTKGSCSAMRYGLTKEEYMEFAKGAYETVEINGLEFMETTIDENLKKEVVEMLREEGI